MPSKPPTALTASLTRALQSREDRWILRRLPSPANSPSPTSPFTDFNSNDYLSLSSSPTLRAKFLQKLSLAPHVLGSGGSRLLVNGQAHSDLEGRLKKFFGSEEALLFNSGFDANVGFFSCVPQSGDIVLFDEYIHASVHDGMRASRVVPSCRVSFAHNCVVNFRRKLDTLCKAHPALRDGTISLFVAVESLYSMDGTFAPLCEMVEILEEVLPKGNGYMVVDEAHATGIYGPQGRGRVAELGLENRVFARLVTFGKALAATGAVLLVPTLIRDYLLNYARSLIYTTSLSYANIVAAGCSFDLLKDGTASRLSSHLQSLSKHLITTLQPHLTRIPSTLLSLPPHLSSSSSPSSTPPSPIIPLHTSHPRPLSAYLLTLGINARPITWPTVPKGKDRVRVCLHAGNTREEVEALVRGVVDWAEEVMRGGVVGGGVERGVGGGKGESVVNGGVDDGEGRMVLSKL